METVVTQPGRETAIQLQSPVVLHTRGDDALAGVLK